MEVIKLHTPNKLVFLSTIYIEDVFFSYSVSLLRLFFKSQRWLPLKDYPAWQNFLKLLVSLQHCWSRRQKRNWSFLPSFWRTAPQKGEQKQQYFSFKVPHLLWGLRSSHLSCIWGSWWGVSGVQVSLWWIPGPLQPPSLSSLPFFSLLFLEGGTEGAEGVPRWANCPWNKQQWLQVECDTRLQGLTILIYLPITAGTPSPLGRPREGLLIKTLSH